MPYRSAWRLPGLVRDWLDAANPDGDSPDRQAVADFWEVAGRLLFQCAEPTAEAVNA